MYRSNLTLDMDIRIEFSFTHRKKNTTTEGKLGRIHSQKGDILDSWGMPPIAGAFCHGSPLISFCSSEFSS